MILFSVSVIVVMKCRRIFVILTRVLDAMLSARKSSEELDENRQPVVVESSEVSRDIYDRRSWEVGGGGGGGGRRDHIYQLRESPP